MKVFSLEKTATCYRLYLFGRRLLFIRNDARRAVQKNQQACLKRVRAKFGREKLRVGFLVSEASKWQYESLYEALEKSAQFEPVILVTKMAFCTQRHEVLCAATMKSCVRFFKEQELRIEFAYDEALQQALPLSNFGVDIVFYQQPWYLYDIHHPINVSEYALTSYMCYGLLLVIFKGMYTKDFHEYLWKMFIEDESLIKEFEKFNGFPAGNCINVGYSKLDAYFDELAPQVRGKKVVIYAPHHSFEKNSLSCATFHRTGRSMLEFARKYKDSIDWVFKPHPRFRYAVVENGIMDEGELDLYYKQWQELGTIHTGGNYFDMFRTSSALITDSCSFLGEYLPSRMPVFQLENNPEVFNSLGRTLISSYYREKTVEDLERDFVRVVLEGDDWLKEERLAKIPLLFDPREKTCDKIVRELVTSFR